MNAIRAGGILGWLLLTSSSAQTFAAEGIAPLAQPSILLARAVPNDSGRADIASSVLPVKGGALITGWSSIGHQPSDGFLMRVTSEGELVWRRSYGGTGVDLLWSVLPDGPNGYIVVGFTASQGAGSFDGWILHVDSEGKTDWEKTYGGPGEDRLTAIQPTPQGWIAVGQTSGRGSGAIDGLVVRVDRDGNELSTWLAGGPGADRAFGIHPLEDGGCLIAGMTGEDRDRIESFDWFVTRLDRDGRRVWAVTERQPGLQVAHDIRKGRDGAFMVYGYGHVNARQGIDGFAKRVRADGSIAATTRFGGETYDRANHAETFDDGSSVVVGYTQRPGATGEEHLWDLMVYAIDPRGEAVWSSRFGGTGVEFGRGIAGTPEDLWVVGHTTSGAPGSQVLVIRLDVSSVVGHSAGSRASK